MDQRYPCTHRLLLLLLFAETITSQTEEDSRLPSQAGATLLMGILLENLLTWFPLSQDSILQT